MQKYSSTATREPANRVKRSMAPPERVRNPVMVSGHVGQMISRSARFTAFSAGRTSDT